MTPEEKALLNLHNALKECGYDGPFALRLPVKEVLRMKARIAASCPDLVTKSHEYWPSEVAFEFNGIRVGKLADGRY